MITSLPALLPIIFILISITTLLLFYWALRCAHAENTQRKAVPVLFILIGWMIIQAAASLLHVYSTNTDSFPPKIMLFGILPPLLAILALFVTSSGRVFIDSLPLNNITWINVVRIPVELGLLLLFLNKAVPLAITFEGRNFDVFSGLTAPFIAYFGFRKQNLSRKFILAWNFICLGLLFNIVITALLSAPLPFQKLAFDQPNIAILYFPFNWLPTFIVPIVLFGHLVSIRQLIKSKENFPVNN